MNDERLDAEQRQRALDAAAGIEHAVALVRYGDARCDAVGDVAFDLVGEVVHVDDGARDAGIREAIEHVVDERATAERHHRLRHGGSEWAHTFAESGGKHEGGRRSGHRGACSSSGGGNQRVASAMMWRS